MEGTPCGRQRSRWGAGEEAQGASGDHMVCAETRLSLGLPPLTARQQPMTSSLESG